MTPENQNELIPLTAGDVLHCEREKRGLSIGEVASRVRVKPEVIAAIESGDTAHIPSVYLKGYIRSYSRQLGLAPDSIEKHLQRDHETEPSVQSVFNTGLPRHPGDRWFKASSYVLASAVVIALVWQFTNEAVRFSQGGSVLRSAGSVEVQPDHAAGGASGKDGSFNGWAEGTRPANTHFKASVAPLELAHDGAGANGRRIAESAWAAVTRTEEVTIPATGAKNDLSKGDLSLEIFTSADSWLEITDASGQQVEMDLLRAGSRRSYGGRAPFSLLIGRASSVELTMNGDKVDLAPYTRGNVARVILGESPEVSSTSEPGSHADQQTE